METFRFWKMEYHTPLHSFINDLREKAATCNFQDTDRMIRDKVVFSMCDKLQQILLREDDLTLAKTIQVCHAYEFGTTTVRKQNSLRQNINNGQTRPKPKTEYIDDCKFCGKRHKLRSKFCPACGKTCHSCNNKNHFQEKCRARKHVHETRHEPDFRCENESDVDSDAYLHTVWTKPVDTLSALLEVNDCPVRF